jgi:hypothetical protein
MRDTNFICLIKKIEARHKSKRIEESVTNVICLIKKIKERVTNVFYLIKTIDVKMCAIHFKTKIIKNLSVLSYLSSSTGGKF